MPSQIVQAIKEICEEKNISYESVLETIEAALASAYRKDYGDREKPQNIKVHFDPETAGMRVFDAKTVVEDMELPTEEELAAMRAEEGERAKQRKAKEAEQIPAPEEGTAAAEEKPKFNPKTMLMISEAKKLKPDAELGEEIRTELPVPGAFGRMAAQTAKQVIMQRIREAERKVIYDEFKGKEGQVLIATIQRKEGRLVLADTGRVTSVMPPDEQITNERYSPGARMKVYVKEVNLTSKGPQVVVSRAHPELVRKLFEVEIPEVATGSVEIKSIAREAGARSKVAVTTADSNIDPIGSCIGQRGTRIQTVSGELGGEKIDVVLWDEEPAVYIKNSLSPAKVTSVELIQEENTARAKVASDQLSLAIGKGGQNVRLAARLSGWRINIVEVKPGGEEELVEEAKPVEETKSTEEVTAQAEEVGTIEEKSVEEKKAEEAAPAEETKPSEELAPKAGLPEEK